MSRFLGSSAPVSGGERGFTLIEILVAAVVLSIGLLALAGLQTSALRNTHSATQRLDAATMAYDILERMRANRANALQGDYDIALGSQPPQGTAVPSQDVAAWKTALAARLPSGDGSIDVENRIVTVTVRWTEAWHTDTADQTATVSVRSQL